MLKREARYLHAIWAREFKDIKKIPLAIKIGCLMKGWVTDSTATPNGPIITQPGIDALRLHEGTPENTFNYR
jgi:hypothetical protein